MSPASALGSGSLPFTYNDFTGGLDTYNSYDLLTDNESRDLLNVQGTTAGAVAKRTGLSTVATIGSQMGSVFAPNKAVLFVADLSKLYSVTIPTGVVTTLKTGLTSPTWEWVSAQTAAGQGPLYGINHLDTPQQGTSSGALANWTNASGGVGVPNGQYMLYHQNQVFIAGTNSNPSRLYWSAIADPTNWDPASLTGAGQMDFDPGDGDVITAIGRVGPYVLVAKPTKLWILVDPATATARRLSESIGCVSNRSMVAGGDGTYFLSRDRGVYVTNGSKITPISDKIQPTIDSISDRTTAAGVYWQAHYYLGVNIGGGSGQANSIVLDFDEKLNSWWKHSLGQSGGMEQWAVAGTAANQAVFGLFGVGALNSHVSQAFAPGVYQDNGANYAWHWAGPWQSPSFYRRRRFPTPYFRKRLRQLRFDGLGQVDLSIAKDFVLPETLVSSDIFGSSSITKEVRLYGQGVANVFSLVFSGTYPTAAQLNAYTMMLADRRDSVVA